MEDAMLSRRIIPCLDVAAGRVVKGTRFRDLRDAGDPVSLAARYFREGADELAFLDIAATPGGAASAADLLACVAGQVFIPLTAGGGVRSVADARRLLRSGADKVAVNTAAVLRPQLIRELSREFGAQAVVLAVDARRRPAAAGWSVFTHAGHQDSGRDAIAWAAEGAALGAGELLLTSMDADGVQTGFDCDLVRAVARVTRVPLIASGGAGAPAHFAEVLAPGGADAALAASIFHQGRCSIGDLKRRLAAAGLPMRLAE
ncbi:MAG: imidazole glycerol phosphate synthase subunit HisF [Terriglobales bacterium]